MKFCIDSADVKEIERLYKIYPIDGVSTNPSILAKAKKDPWVVLHEIRDIVQDGELFVQVVAKDCKGMVEDAKAIVHELGRNTIVKIPVTIEGMKAIKICKKDNIRLLGTCVYTPIQGFLAAQAGCEYVAPYINRINNTGFSGIQVAKDIHDMISNNNLDSGLLAASFKDVNQVVELWKYGVKACTVTLDVFEKLLDNAIVDNAVDKFVSDIESITHKGYTLGRVELDLNQD